jgi:hypothetical protein
MIRHVKCDESRPFCHGCVSTGRTCDGYLDGPKMKNKESTLIFVPPDTVSRSLLHIQPSLNQKEAQHLDHFRHVVVGGMSGFVPSPLWEKLILQAVHGEPAVCHAAVAFSALQLAGSISSPTTDTSLQIFALRQYSTSIKEFQRLLAQHTPHSIEAALICSIICICFEILEGSHILAQGHLENSLRVISASEGMQNTRRNHISSLTHCYRND